MLSDITSDEQDHPRCGHCGAPLTGRFTPCPACHARPVDSRGLRSAPPPPLTIPLDEPHSTLDARLPARRTWRPSSRALVNPYDIVGEPVTAAPARQRLRQPMVLGASVLVVASAVYLGFIHSNDLKVGPPIEVSGKVKTQNVAPPNAVAQRPAATAPKQAADVAAQRSAAVIAEQSATVAHQRSTTVASQQSAAAAAQRSATVAARSSAPVKSPPTPPAAPRSLASVATVASNTPNANRNPGSQTGNPADKPRADVSKHLRAARADLQRNNLSATKARLAAAIAAQPDNRDALTMRSMLSTREQQRDALLSLARGCGYIARWTCVSRNAGTALQIDTSSKEAQRLVTLAARESETQFTQPVAPAPDQAADTHELDNHH